MEMIRLIRYLLAGKVNRGFCPVCESATLFIEEQSWLRDHYVCIRCHSIPRFRALIHTLTRLYPDYQTFRIHESSPGGAATDKLARRCKGYLPSHYFPDVPGGGAKQGVRCENLEQMTFAGETFDMVITQDVLEHVLQPDKAFAEISRILKPGGAHLFTVPYYAGRKTKVRARLSGHDIEYLDVKIFHGNPIDSEGSLVVTEWGDDLFDFIYLSSGMTTAVYKVIDRKLGIDGEFLEVFVSTKSN